MLTSWEELPNELRLIEVEDYFNYLKQKKFSLIFKRGFDLLFSVLLVLIFLPFFFLIGVIIKLDSKGTVMYLQERVTQNNKDFLIYKFRTMVMNADNKGTLITVDNDLRITRVGGFLRKYRLDELPQLFNIIKGEMSFVGTRPEVRVYVEEYTPEMMATLLLPAGVTSKASLLYKDEQSLLNSSQDINKTYIKEILPGKMKYNLEYLRKFSVKEDLCILFSTIKVIFLN